MDIKLITGELSNILFQTKRIFWQMLVLATALMIVLLLIFVAVLSMIQPRGIIVSIRESVEAVLDFLYRGHGPGDRRFLLCAAAGEKDRTDPRQQVRKKKRKSRGAPWGSTMIRRKYPAFYFVIGKEVSRMSFVKMSNQIFGYPLTPKAVFVYVYLLSRANCLQHAVVKYAVIAEHCNMDAKTVRQAIRKLEGCQLVEKHNRYGMLGYRANGYFVKNMIVDNKGWFPIDRRAFATGIKATDFVVYCYICKCMSAEEQEAFPSLTRISQGTGISRSRVARAVNYLWQFTFLNRVRRRYKRTRKYRQNRYLHFACNGKKGMRKARPLPGSQTCAICFLFSTLPPAIQCSQEVEL